MGTLDKMKVDQSEPILVLVGDPLSDVTRRMRRTLAATSLLAIAVLSGARPTSVQILGVGLPNEAISILIRLMWISLTYFFLTFCIYAYHDYLTWRSKLLRASRLLTGENPLTDQEEFSAAFDDAIDEHPLQIRFRASDQQVINDARRLGDGMISLPKFLFQTSWPAALRIGVDFLIPPVLAVIVLIWWSTTQIGYLSTTIPNWFR